MVWVKRTFTFADYAPYFDILKRLLLQNPTRYREFIMVSIDLANSRDSVYFVGVPDKSFLVHFDGFEPVDEKDLPKIIDTLHIAEGSSPEFTSRFEF
jgi:hypothetical protein